MSLIEREAAIALIEEKQKELCPVGRFSRNAVYGTDKNRFDAWDEIIDQIGALPTIDPIRAAGGCRCGECMYWDDDGRCEPPENGLIREYTKPTDFCSYGEAREA